MIWNIRCSQCGDKIAVRTITAVQDEVHAQLKEKGWRVDKDVENAPWGKPVCHECVNEERLKKLEDLRGKV